MDSPVLRGEGLDSPPTPVILTPTGFRSGQRLVARNGDVYVVQPTGQFVKQTIAPKRSKKERNRLRRAAR